jgi:serine/threonine-protein kinase
MSVDLRNFDLREGDLLAGKFRVERLLGSGGMGVVVEATHVTLKDRVALKFLRSPKFADRETITRFLREAQAAARIKSPHVARVLDVGTLDDGAPYMVMEFLEGTDLATILDRDGVFPIEQAVTYALQTCEALAAAHASNVVHRDVKPSNIFLTQGPDRAPLIKVLDFGISKMLDGTTSGSITETQRAVGSPSYMAPEQMRSAKRVDGRADIWSMGVVLYELVTGRAPFVAETIPELYALILDKSSRPTPLRSLRPEIPEELERVAERCLEKDAADRFADVGELAAALAPFGGEFGPISAARTRRILEAAALAGNVARAEPSDRSARPSRPTPSSPQRQPTESPPTVREGAGGASSSRASGDAPASPSASVLTATSFAESQPPARAPRTVLAASIGVIALGLVVLGVMLAKGRGDAPLGNERAAPAALAAPREQADPQRASAAASEIATAAATGAALAETASSTPVALSAPSSSASSAPLASAAPSTSGFKPAGSAGAAASRVARPKPGAPPPGDDVLLHRK